MAKLGQHFYLYCSWDWGGKFPIAAPQCWFGLPFLLLIQGGIFCGWVFLFVFFILWCKQCPNLPKPFSVIFIGLE